MSSEKALREALERLIKTCREDGAYSKEVGKQVATDLGEQGEPFDSLDIAEAALAASEPRPGDDVVVSVKDEVPSFAPRVVNQSEPLQKGEFNERASAEELLNEISTERILNLPSSKGLEAEQQVAEKFLARVYTTAYTAGRAASRSQPYEEGRTVTQERDDALDALARTCIKYEEVITELRAKLAAPDPPQLSFTEWLKQSEHYNGMWSLDALHFAEDAYNAALLRSQPAGTGEK